MWVAGDTLMLWPMIPVALSWMRLEERRAARIDRELDAAEAAETSKLLEDRRTGPSTPDRRSGHVRVRPGSGRRRTWRC